jgi:hypothetical protein
VAGSRRTCINWQFAQAGRYSRQHEDHSYGDDQFPFSYPTLSDPISGRSSGILQRARDAGVCPKVLHLDTESDLWQARSSLVVTDTSGADIAMPDEVRVYTVSGVSHAPFRPLTKPAMQLPGNRLGYGAFMRALLVALFEWVEHGIAPPDSRFPSRAAGTLVPLAEAVSQERDDIAGRGEADAHHDRTARAVDELEDRAVIEARRGRPRDLDMAIVDQTPREAGRRDARIPQCESKCSLDTAEALDRDKCFAARCCTDQRPGEVSPALTSLRFRHQDKLFPREIVGVSEGQSGPIAAPIV